MLKKFIITLGVFLAYIMLLNLLSATPAAAAETATPGQTVWIQVSENNQPAVNRTELYISISRQHYSQQRGQWMNAAHIATTQGHNTAIRLTPGRYEAQVYQYDVVLTKRAFYVTDSRIPHMVVIALDAGAAL